MQFPTVSDIIISKPKRDGSTYLATICYQRKKNACEICIKGATCIMSNNAVLIKSKSFMDFMSDLNEYVIDIVKQNCEEWFNNNMSLDLIDEYYSNPMKYDKVYGYVVRIKHEGDISQKQGKVNVRLKLNGLRFLKQKFGLEWDVVSVTEDMKRGFEFDMVESEESMSDVASDEDIPEPIPDDVSDIKNQYFTQLREIKKSLQTAHENILAEIAQVDDALLQIENADNFKVLSKIYDSIENLQCSKFT
jgi:hypothetical protein